MTSGSGIPPISVNTPRAAGDGAQVVQIVSLPDGLKNNAKAIRIEGEVTAQNKDGSVRIHTDSGDIDIIIRGKQPDIGTQVEMDIPPASSARIAIVRVPVSVPPQAQAPTATAAGDQFTPSVRLPPSLQTPTPQTADTRASSPEQKPSIPLSQGYQPTTQQAAAEQKPPSTTTPSPYPVRLMPISAAQAQTDIAQTLMALIRTQQTAITTQIARIATMPMLPPTATDGTIEQALPTQQALSSALPQTGTSNASKTVIAPPLQSAPLPTPIGALFSALRSFTSFDTNTGNGNQVPPSIKTTLFAYTPITTGKIISFPLMGQTPIPDLSAHPSLDFTVLKSPPQGIIAPQSNQARLAFFPTMSSPQAQAPNMEILVHDGLVFAKQNNALVKVQSVFSQSAFLIESKTGSFFSPSINLASNPFRSTSSQNMTGESFIAASIVKPSSNLALIIGFTAQKIPIVMPMSNNAGLGASMVLQTQILQSSVGDLIELVPQSLSQNAAHSPTLKPAHLPLLENTLTWPALEEIAQALSQISPEALQSFTRTIPSPANGSNFAATTLLFLSALRSGDLSGWLGEKRIDILTKSGKDPLIKRLLQDGINAASQSVDKPQTEWRSYPLPLLWHNDISKAMIHFKQDTPQEERQNKDGSTRFILDLSLSHMGDIQLDGLLRGPRLDLLVRTQSPISLSMQSAMKSAYAEALNGTQFFGELGFQGDIKGWVHVLKREEKLTLSS